MRKAARTDANHTDIVKALRDVGIAVKSTAAMGKGFPDLICALRETTVLLEVKGPGGKLEVAQVEFIATWPGLVYVVTSPEEAVRVVVEAARPAA